MIEAVAEGRVGPVAETLEGAAAESVVAAATAIAAKLETTRQELEQLLAAAGINGDVRLRKQLPQNHSILLEVASAKVARRAGSALQAAGFELWDDLRRGARRSFERYGTRTVMARTDAVTTVVRITWPARSPRTRLGRVLQPTQSEWRSFDLPTWAWRAYSVLRVWNLLRARRGRSVAVPPSAGPFLATPDSLIDPLLDLAGVGPETRFVDMGCGDGRLVAAAAQRGASAIGVEITPALARRAQQRVDEAGLADRAEIVCGSAADVALEGVDVVFMFLPGGAVARLLPGVLDRLGPGACVLVHEQLPLKARAAPTHSDLVVSDDAITVAHRWYVD